jgi:thiol-disulfide isomerase/thioredoxin
VNYEMLAALERPALPVAPDRIHALLLNGSGRPEANSASHLAHIRELTSILTRAGVAPARISILSGDGDDPSPDLALAEPEPEQAWLLAGTSIGERLLQATRYESSTVPSFTLRPATLPELKRWFKTTGARLRDGDTLLLYVTDHGTQNARDVLETRIVLWGKDASISVREMRDLLRAIPRGVRVVTLMSQCFSGGFAWLSRKDGELVPERDVCGYFSSRFDRKAYGCFADLSRSEDLGHSFTFLQALARTGRFDDAHRYTLVGDRTPDVPLRSSDLWLQEMLLKIADSGRFDPIALIDALLAKAWENPAAWEPEIRLLDRIGQTYGFASPRTLRDMEDVARRLSHVQTQIESFTDAWTQALAGANQANLDDFLAATPAWAPRLAAANEAPRLEVGKINAEAVAQSRAVAAELLTELGAFTSDRKDAFHPAKALAKRASMGDALTYRTEARIAAILRIGAVLSSIAGRTYLASYGEPELVAAYRAMRACEGLSLPGLGAGAAATPPPEAPDPMPSLADELDEIEQIIPAWVGWEARPVKAESAAQHNLPRGAAVVTAITMRSPAADARLQRGDVLLGPPGAPFLHPQDFLPWSMLLSPGEAKPVLFQRRGATFTATIKPRAHRMSWGGLAALAEGAKAPALGGALYRGARLPSGRQLLFFWATWCEPCKAAVPALLAFAKERGTPVVAITDEGAEQLDTFFASWKGAFPEIVVSDEPRRSQNDYGISGTPTFVLIDDAGRIRRMRSGYSEAIGLSFLKLE